MTTEIDLARVNELPSAHRFRYVGDELHVTDGEGWSISDDVVDVMQPIRLGNRDAMLPLAGGFATPVSVAHALLYATTFGMLLETRQAMFLVQIVRPLQPAPQEAPPPEGGGSAA